MGGRRSARWALGCLSGYFGLCGVALGQVSVLTIAEGETGVQRSERVALTQLGSFEREALSVGRDLAFGDELTSAAAGIAVVLLCSETEGDAEITLSSPFRVVLMPTTSGRGCALNLPAGTADVLAGTDTEIHAGEVTLGSERTRYGISVRRAAGNVEDDVYVFDGAVRVVRRKLAPVRLTAGKRMALKGAAPARMVKLHQKDFTRAARVYAKVDASRTQLTGEALQRSFRRLEAVHTNVLREPDNAEPRVQLAVARMNLNVKTPSTLHYLTQAQTLNKGDTALLANTAMIKGMVFQSLGDEEMAKKEYRAAKAIDPAVTREEVGQVHKINPLFLQRIQPPTIERLAPGRYEAITPNR